MVAAARAVGVELRLLDPVLVEVERRRRALLDRAGRRDVVGRDRVAEQREHARALDVAGVRRLGRDVLEERRAADVGRVVLPRVAVALRHLERVPLLAAVEHLAVGLLEHLGAHGLLDDAADLLGGRPDVVQEDVVAVGVLAERLVEQVDVHRPRERVRDDERRRREVVHLHVGVDPALEVAVAGQHGDDREVLGVDDVGDLLRQRPGVPDARRAAVADEVEAERLERLDQARLVVVLHDDLRARGERRLDPRLGLQPALDRVARQQAGADHHRRVRRVRARRDRRDHDVAVVELGLGAVGERERDELGDAVGDLRAARAGRRRAPAGGRAPSRRSSPAGRRRGTTPRTARRPRCGAARPGRRARAGTTPLDSVSETRSCGRFGPASDGTTSPRSSSSVSEYVGLLGVRVVPQALRLRVGLDALELLGRAAGELEVAQRLGVDREDRAGRAELRRHVADRRPVGERQVGDPGAVELDELADDAVLAQHLGDGQHEVGGGRALAQLAAELEADHARDQHRHRLAEHRRLGLDPADAPAQHAEAVDHRRVRVGPDERVGIQHAVVLEHDAGEVLEVDLVDDAGVRRHGLEALERRLAPAQERVALAVALVLLLGVDPERLRRAEGVDLDGVVDHQLDRHERVDRRRVAAHLGHRVAQRGEVDDARDAGEVLQDHARGREGDLLRRLGLRVPRRERLDVLAADADAVLVAQQVLEQHLQREGQPRDVVGRLAAPRGGRSRTRARRPRARRARRRNSRSSWVLPVLRHPSSTPFTEWRTSGTTRARRRSCRASAASRLELGGVRSRTRAARCGCSRPATRRRIYLPRTTSRPACCAPAAHGSFCEWKGAPLPRRARRATSARAGRIPPRRALRRPAGHVLLPGRATAPGSTTSASPSRATSTAAGSRRPGGPVKGARARRSEPQQSSPSRGRRRCRPALVLDCRRTCRRGRARGGRGRGCVHRGAAERRGRVRAQERPDVARARPRSVPVTARSAGGDAERGSRLARRLRRALRPPHPTPRRPRRMIGSPKSGMCAP